MGGFISPVAHKLFPHVLWKLKVIICPSGEVSSGDRGGGKLGLLTVTNSPAQLQREREREQCVGDLSEAGWAQLKAPRIIAFCEMDISYTGLSHGYG